jgi:hypothetical protein
MNEPAGKKRTTPRQAERYQLEEADQKAKQASRNKNPHWGIKTTAKDRQKYIKQLLEVKEDPVRAVKKAKRLRNITFAISVLVMFALLSFPQIFTGLIHDAVLCVFAILVSIAVVHGMLIKNIPLGLEFIDWEKVKRSHNQEPPPPLPQQQES